MSQVTIRRPFGELDLCNQLASGNLKDQREGVNQYPGQDESRSS